MTEIISKKLKTAPCQGACPAGVDVPRYIRYIRAGKFTEALNVIRESIPFPAVCGYACFHPCEAQCARRQYDEPLSIRMLKRAAVDFGWEGMENAAPAEPTGQKVAVVGAGPAGLTAAYYLAGKGHHVTVFERRSQAGGLMRYGIPEYRLPNEIVDREIALIRERGVEIRTNSPVDSPKELLNKGYAAVCAATGAWKSAQIILPAITDSGENSRISPGEVEAASSNVGAVDVAEGLAFLEATNTREITSASGRVVVVGGGNTAIDAARTAVRLGARDVTIVYRRTRSEMPANSEEIADASQEGVKFEFLAAPVAIGINELHCIRMALGEPDAGGRPQPQPVADSEFKLPCGQVILAIGQSAAASSFGLPENPNGTIKTTDSLAVGVAGIYAAGDIVKGPSSVIEAIAQGRRAAVEIDKMLGGDGVIAEKWIGNENEVIGRERLSDDIDDFASLGQIRPETVHIALGERISSFGLAECGYDRKTAVAESGRCLGCDIHSYEVKVEADYCKDCGYCREVCGQGVYEQSSSFNLQGYRPMEAAATDQCVGCLKCLMICPDFAISVG